MSTSAAPDGGRWDVALPIHPRQGMSGDEAAVRAMRDEAKPAVEALIASLLDEQARDKARS